jgi:hypothetical protein
MHNNGPVVALERLPLSDTPANFDLREQVARIDRAIAETGKLQEETQKCVTEQRKLLAEAAKPQRDRMLAPWQLVLGASRHRPVCGGLPR